MFASLWLSRHTARFAFSSAHRLFWSALPLAAVLVAALSSLFTIILLRRYRQVIRTPQDTEDITGYRPLALLPVRSNPAGSIFDDHMVRFAAQVEGHYRRTGCRSFLLTPCDLREDTNTLVPDLRDKLLALGLSVAAVPASTLFTPAAKSAWPPGLGATSTESFATHALEELKTKHDLVLIEATALLASGEVEYLARYVESTLLLVQCGITARRDLHAATLLLEHIEATGIRIVLEQVRPRDLIAQRLFAERPAARQQVSSLGLSDLAPRKTPAEPRTTAHEETNISRSIQADRAQQTATYAQATSPQPQQVVRTPLANPVSEPASQPLSLLRASALGLGSSRPPRPLANWSAPEPASTPAHVREEDSPVDEPIGNIYVPLEDFDVNAAPFVDFPSPSKLTPRQANAAPTLSTQSAEQHEGSHNRWERIPLLRPYTGGWEQGGVPTREVEVTSPDDARRADPEVVSRAEGEDKVREPPYEPPLHLVAKGNLSRRWSLLSRYLDEQGSTDETKPN